MYNYGKCLEDGTGVERDPALALIMYKDASARGQADAQARLGLVYEQGQLGEAINLAEACRLYKASSAQGNPSGMFFYGDLLERGVMVAKDEREALRLYESAAKGSLPQAHGRLGDIYMTGRCGVTRNYGQAKEHFLEQAKLGEEVLAEYSLGVLARDRVDGSGDKNAAIEHFKRAAALGHVDSVLRLADLLEEMGRLKEANQELRMARETFHETEVVAREGILWWIHGDPRGKQRGVLVLKDAADKGCQRAIDFMKENGIL
jgi:TPR repeat protein